VRYSKIPSIDEIPLHPFQNFYEREIPLITRTEGNRPDSKQTKVPSVLALRHILKDQDIRLEDR